MWWIVAAVLYLLIGAGVARLLADNVRHMIRDWRSLLKCVFLWPLLLVAYIVLALAWRG